MCDVQGLAGTQQLSVNGSYFAVRVETMQQGLDAPGTASSTSQADLGQAGGSLLACSPSLRALQVSALLRTSHVGTTVRAPGLWSVLKLVLTF